MLNAAEQEKKMGFNDSVVKLPFSKYNKDHPVC